MNNTFVLFFVREWRLLFRNSSALVLPLVFFIMIALIFVFAQAADSGLTGVFGGGIIWVSALLACLLSFENMFGDDYQDGSLEQWLIHSRSLALALLGKVAAHWCATGLLLSLFAPLLCLIFGMPVEQIWVLSLGLLLGTPSLTLIGAIGAALTVSLQRGGVLIAIVILPLCIPVLIFGAGMLTQLSLGYSIIAELYALAAILILAISLAPFAIAGALRITVI